MSGDIHRRIHEGILRERDGRLRYTGRAYAMLPPLRRPLILDVGCGGGEVTAELARLSSGEVIGLDIDLRSLTELRRKIEKEGLSSRVHAVKCSMLEMGFPRESFDVIWAEGSIHIVGFEQGLDSWGECLRPGGFLVVHEMVWLRPDPPKGIHDHWKSAYPGIRTVPEYVAEVPAHGLSVRGHFTLPEDFWWWAYYGPLEERLRELREEYSEDRQARQALDGEQHEVDLFKKYSHWYGSAFFIMRKEAAGGHPPP